MTCEAINNLIDSIARKDEEALIKLYEEYAEAFYCTAFSILKNEKDAYNAAVEAFRRIRSNAYRFDESLDGEYWIFDVIYKIAYNKYLSAAGRGRKSIKSSNIMAVYEPEVYIKCFSDLDAGEIAAITEKKKKDIKENLKKAEQDFARIKSSANGYVRDYRNDIISSSTTGMEVYSEETISKSDADIKKQGRRNSYKRIMAIIMASAFLCAAVAVVIALIVNNYGSDVVKTGPGDDVMLQFNNTIAVTEMNGSVYFCGDGNALYMRNMSSGETVKISDDNPKELLNDGQNIYYRNMNDGYMYKVNADGSDKTKLCDVPGTAMEIYDGWMYFSTTGGIYRISLEGGTINDAELIFDNTNDANLFCVDTAVDKHGNVFFASGIGKGLHYITEYNGNATVEGIFVDEVFTIMIDNDMLYFDHKEANGRILLYCLDLNDYLNNGSDKRVQPKVVSDSAGENIVLSTGAFYAAEGCVYYAGKLQNSSVLFKLDKNKNVSTVTEIPEKYKNNLVISDIYISNEWAYCFGADGKSNGKRLFFAKALNKDNSMIIYES